MTIYGIGIDIVETDRIATSIREYGERFTGRVFTSAEREYCDRMRFAERHYAARFAAKEAIAKAFGTGIGANLEWSNMEILRNAEGKPFVQLSGAGKEFAAKAGITSILISLSHSDHHAAANAVAVCGE